MQIKLADQFQILAKVRIIQHTVKNVGVKFMAEIKFGPRTQHRQTHRETQWFDTVEQAQSWIDTWKTP